MKKDKTALQHKLESTVCFIEDLIKHAQEIELSNPLRTEYAINLAVKLRVLLNDENSNTSLLQLLGIKNNLLFPACEYNGSIVLMPSNLVYSSSLTSICVINGELFCKANDFKVSEDLLYSFDAWWNEIIIDSKSELLSQISRRDVVLTLSDKEGGAHVDPNYDTAYYQAIKNNNFVLISPDGEEKHIQNDVYAEAVIFIASEFLNAFYVFTRLKPYNFIKEVSPHHILQLTYFRNKERSGHSYYEKRYRFFRIKRDAINKHIMVLFDYYQLASYRILDLYQISNRFPNGDLIYAQVANPRSHSEQIVYARTENCEIHLVLQKSDKGFRPVEKVDAIRDDRKLRSLEEIALLLSPANPHAFDTYLSKQIIDEPC